MEKLADTIEAMENPMFEEMIVTDDMPPAGEVLIVDEPAPAQKKKFDLKTNRDLSQFIPYLEEYIAKLPTHSGKTTAGCERGIAHCHNGDKMISQVIAGDLDGELDDQVVEKYRKKLRQMKKELEKRHKEINDAYDADDAKYADDVSNVLVKEATMHCKKCGAQVSDQKAAKHHVEMAHKGESDIAFTDYQSNGSDDKKYKCDKCGKQFDEAHIGPHEAMCFGNSADDKKEDSACACKIEKNATPEDENCPKCKIKLWKASESLFECIACDETFEKSIIKQANTPRVQLVMTTFERAITGIIVNAVVSQGRNAEEAYSELKKQYKFSERDELGIQQLLTDLGYPVARNFMSSPHKNVEFSTNYQA